MKHQIPVMLKQGSGSIVNCSSVAGLTGFNGMSAYVSAKHGLLGLTKSAALDYAKANIRINAVCPGIIQTPMIERFTQGRPENLKDLTSSEPIGRVGSPEEVAEAVLWLCSDASSFVLGATLSIDGGMSAQ
jgi:NAD(P)-dependent dehydrogenase (short-subunit alcohol dehydrogenase family)